MYSGQSLNLTRETWARTIFMQEGMENWEAVWTVQDLSEKALLGYVLLFLVNLSQKQIWYWIFSKIWICVIFMLSQVPTHIRNCYYIIFELHSGNIYKAIQCLRYRFWVNVEYNQMIKRNFYLAEQSRNKKLVRLLDYLVYIAEHGLLGPQPVFNLVVRYTSFCLHDWAYLSRSGLFSPKSLPVYPGAF